MEKKQIEGDTKTKITTIYFVGFILCILAIGGIISLFTADDSQMMWGKIETLLTMGISGLIGLHAGERMSSK